MNIPDLLETNQSTILLAEDNLINQKVAREMLEMLGYRVDLVDNGVAALNALENNDYKFICMDCQMPVMDGMTATRHIREREQAAGKKSHLPVLAMTANAMAENYKACLVAGFDAIIAKPFGLEDLKKALQVALQVS